MRLILFVAVAIAGMGMVWADEAAAACGCCCRKPVAGGPAQALPKFDPAKIKQVTLSVDGMTCASCVATVQKALSAVPGVSHVQVDLKTKQAAVLVELNRFDQKALLTAVEKAGYPGKMLK